MITLAISVAFTVVLLTIGCSWIEVGIAIPLFLVISRGTTRVESWVERLTGRKSNPKSAGYAATYFLIALGVMLRRYTTSRLTSDRIWCDHDDVVYARDDFGNRHFWVAHYAS